LYEPIHILGKEQELRYMFDHDTVLIENPLFGEPVAVDCDIAMLIQSLWKLGINIDDSCQNIGSGCIWIQFSSGQDAIRFLTLVAEIRDLEGPEAADGLYFRMLNAEDGWDYEVGPWDVNLELNPAEQTGGFTGPPDLVLPVGVKFPIADYFRILHLIRSNLRAKPA
jgi:hypothetical protein